MTAPSLFELSTCERQAHLCSFSVTPLTSDIRSLTRIPFGPAPQAHRLSPLARELFTRQCCLSVGGTVARFAAAWCLSASLRLMMHVFPRVGQEAHGRTFQKLLLVSVPLLVPPPCVNLRHK